MSEDKIRYRMSAIQKSILKTLYLLSKRRDGPIEVRKLRQILNKERDGRGIVNLQTSNFSVSCKLLHERGYLLKFRDEFTTHVAYQLTKIGFSEGEKECTKWLKELEEQDK